MNQDISGRLYKDPSCFYTGCVSLLNVMLMLVFVSLIMSL